MTRFCKLTRMALSIAIAMSFTRIASASECDRSLDPAGGDIGYSIRAGQRCEGMFASQVSGESMELVSLTYGASLGAAPQTEALLISGPPDEKETLHLRAVGIPIGFYYRMDAELRPGVRFVWPTKLLIRSIGVALDQVGIFAFTRSSAGDIVYLPVALSIGDYVNGPLGSGVIAELRPLTLVEKARWRFAPSKGTATLWKTISVVDDLLVIRLSDSQTSGTLQVSWSDPRSGAPAESQFRISF